MWEIMGRTHVFRFAALVQPRDPLELHVGPEYRAGVHVGRRGHDVLHDDRYAFKALFLKVGHQDRVPVRDDQKRHAMVCEQTDGRASIFIK